ncbi:MAG: glycine-rich domain-containing protein [Bdellovibrionota bacterium]
MISVLTSLEEVLAYQNPDVVARFAEDFKIPSNDAQDIFHELKRWLWLCAKRKIDLEQGRGEPFQVPLFNEANAIDMMWHTFLLFTEDYAAFCQKFFGFFIHHNPRPFAERSAWQEKIKLDFAGATKERKASLKKVYEYLYDELGAEVLIKWCEEFPARFPFSQKP